MAEFNTKTSEYVKMCSNRTLAFLWTYRAPTGILVHNIPYWYINRKVSSTVLYLKSKIAIAIAIVYEKALGKCSVHTKEFES